MALSSLLINTYSYVESVQQTTQQNHCNVQRCEHLFYYMYNLEKYIRKFESLVCIR